MYSWKTVHPGTELAKIYDEKVSEFFPQCFAKDYSEDICILFNGEIVGGFTLRTLPETETDLDFFKFWKMLRPIQGTRILKLWTKAQAPRSTLAYIFRTLLEVIDPETYLYGVLSLPLGFALSQAETLQNTKKYLKPHLPLEKCQWNPEAEPSSEGKKLLHFYLRAGAEILGPASGSLADHSVRVVVGLKLANANHAKKERIYETTARQILGA